MYYKNMYNDGLRSGHWVTIADVNLFGFNKVYALVLKNISFRLWSGHLGTIPDVILFGFNKFYALFLKHISIKLRFGH